MRKSITIVMVAVMILVGFVAMASSIASDVPSITKTMYVDGPCPCDKGAWLGDKVIVKINVYDVPAGGGTVCDKIPEMFSYVPGSFMVGGIYKTPSMKNGMISYKVGPGNTEIIFKILYDSAPPATTKVWNTATLYYGDCESVSAEDYVWAEAYCGFHKYFEIISGDDGDDKIEVGEDIHWNFWITVSNINNGYTMTDVTVWDRLGAELEIDAGPFVTKGTVDINLKGKSEKIELKWSIGDLAPSSSAELTMEISTDLNPAGKQEYTSPGCYFFNSGAVLKFRNNEGIQLSAHTPQLTVTVYEQDGLP